MMLHALTRFVARLNSRRLLYPLLGLAFVAAAARLDAAEASSQFGIRNSELGELPTGAVKGDGPEASDAAVSAPVMAVSAAASVPCGGCGQLPRPADSLWLISDRRLGCGDSPTIADRFEYWHYDGPAGWQRSSSAMFFAGDDPQVPTTIWVHGNQIDGSQAFGVGWSVYRSLVAAGCNQPPLRFVIWSWPSVRVGRPLQDVRIKAGRTVPSSRHLAALINRIDSGVPVSLFGYSYGARIVSGALHLLGGGVLNGYKLAQPLAAPRKPMNVVLIAAALDNDWLLPGHSHGLALSQMERLLLINNSCDRALRHYHLLYGRRRGAAALGSDGFAGLGSLGAARRKVVQFDACCLVGRRHDWSSYFGQPSIAARVSRGLWAPAPTVGTRLARAG